MYLRHFYQCVIPLETHMLCQLLLSIWQQQQAHHCLTCLLNPIVKHGDAYLSSQGRFRMYASFSDTDSLIGFLAFLGSSFARFSTHPSNSRVQWRRYIMILTTVLVPLLKPPPRTRAS